MTEIHAVKPGWDRKQTLKYVHECQAEPLDDGACPRCKTRLSQFSCVGVTLCLICNIKYENRHKRILPSLAKCENPDHKRHHLRIPYQRDKDQPEQYHDECTECWVQQVEHKACAVTSDGQSTVSSVD